MLPRYGSYEAIRRLAIGGMGEIFLARQVGIKGFERLAIIKTLLNESEDDEDRIEMFPVSYTHLTLPTNREV